MFIHSIHNSNKVLAIHTPLLLIQPNIACDLGVFPAMFIQQLHYWLNSKSHIGKVIDGKRWIYNSYGAWAANFKCRSQSTIKRTIKKLKDLDIILSDNFNKNKSNRTKWYTIDYEKLKEFFPDIFEKIKDTIFQDKVKMTLSSGQNDLMYKGTKKTPETTVLNRTCARETILPSVLEEQPVQVEAEVIETEPSIVEQVLQAVELLSSQLTKPLEIKKPSAVKVIEKRMKSHFGSLEALKTYLDKVARTPILVGQKLMKSKDRFVLSFGSLFSERLIKASWDDSWLFDVWLPKEQPETQDEEEMPRKAKPVELPLLSLTEVLANAKNPFDKAVKSKLFELLGEKIYRSWFHGTNFVARGMRNGQPQFEINGNHARDLVTTRYRAQLKAAFEGF